MDSCIRIIGLLRAMGVISSLRGWTRLIGIVSVPPLSEIGRRRGMCPFTRSQWGGMRVCVYDLAYPRPEGWWWWEEQDSAVFKRDQGEEVQWGLVGGDSL